MKKLFILLALAGLISATGCMRTSYVTGASPETDPSYDKAFQHHVVLGLVPLTDPVELQEVCPSGVAEIKTKTSFINGLVRALSQSIYTPRTVEVYCADGTSHILKAKPEAQLSQNQ